ncbi:MAG: glycosyltransferase family 2 protein [Planctomycetes bacterium]|nr:glycosyltransferase family 2 protein [Planctomycetota bacterium]MBM4058479.1 glycosyltransferase family 2 protein [Planctomycetota bacterium]
MTSTHQHDEGTESTAGAFLPITVVMPTIGFEEPFIRCAGRVLEVMRLDRGDEVIVVFDGIAPPPPAWLVESGAAPLSTGRRSGPAAARNLAAAAAHGDVILFVDADVELARDAVERVRARFVDDPGLCAVFGAYDDRPAAPGLVSRFRNLLHHHVHVLHAGPAETFWAGCGAMKADVFRALGGFDVHYTTPSIEDIELGARAAAAGGRLLLDPGISCTHHKRWTLRSMIVTDVFQRAIPWTRQMLASGHVSRRLNLDWKSRVSGVAAVVAAAATVAAAGHPGAMVVMLAGVVVLLVVNRGFYALCLRRGGPAFAAGCFLLHWLYFVYATVAFAVVTVSFRILGR